MANRPRRPKSESGASATVGPQDVAGKTPASIETGVETAVDASAGVPEDVPSEPASPAVPDAVGDRGLPPRSEPPLDDPAAVAQQALGEDRRDVSTDDKAEAATEALSAEEGLAAKAGEPPRRHLGEFEDDETLVEGAETHPVSVTNAYAEGSERPITPETQPPSSFGPNLGAGLAGAILALLGGAALLYSGILPPPGGNEPSAQYASAGDLEGVSSEVATLRAGLEQLQSADAAGGAGGFASAADLAELRDRLTALEQGGPSAPAGEAAQPTAPDPVETLRPEIAGVQEAANSAQTTATSAQTRADEAQVLATSLDGRVSEFDGRLGALEAAQESARIALAAAGLKAAIDRGGPFMPELEGFASAGGAPDAVESLRPFAAKGVPTQRQIADEWPDAEQAIRQALASPGEGAGLGGQFMAGLSSLVTVRSTGETAQEGDGPEASLARMNAAVQAGDFDAWSSEWDGLDAAAQDASRDFADRVLARREASGVVESALGGAVAGNQG